MVAFVFIIIIYLFLKKMNEYSRFNTTKKSIRDKEIYLT